MKILVAIANHGTKNLKYLQVLLAEYQRMSFDVDIVILSNEPKGLGANVQVLVGIPAKNPWSLPFAHKSLFAQRVKDYDLFIYSEDDTLITEKNINAFLESTRVLPRDQIAGFLRYETGPDGKRHVSSAHGRFHWQPESAKQWGTETFARFTNDHSACFILTREQLERAIASGGFLLEPYEGEYDMLVTAATDPYTRCGVTKVVNISRIEDFLLPHLPNRYVGVMGTEYPAFMASIEALKQIAAGKRPATSALPNRQLPGKAPWLKNFYEPCSREMINLVPKSARSILSLGMGIGATESELVRLNHHVTAIPLDSVICAPAEAAGVEIVHGELARGLETLRDRRFDCVIARSLLYLQEDPQALVLKAASLLTAGGHLVLCEPNFGNIQTYGGRLINSQHHQVPASYKESGMTPITAGRARRWLKSAGLSVGQVIHIPDAAPSKRVKQLGFLPAAFFSEEFVIAAQRRV